MGMFDGVPGDMECRDLSIRVVDSGEGYLAAIDAILNSLKGRSRRTYASENLIGVLEKAKGWAKSMVEEDRGVKNRHPNVRE